MTGLFFALLATLLVGFGARDQLLVAQLAERQGARPALLLVAAVSAAVTAGLAALAGAEASTLLAGTARLFLVTLAVALAGGDAERAASIFMQIAELAPDNVAAQGGLLRALIAAGHIAEAEAVLAELPEAMAKDAEIARVRAALDLAKDRPADDELGQLRAAATPDNPDGQLAFAAAAFAAGERDAAAETLLAMIATDRAWNEGAAKAKLLQIFEAVGLEDPWVAATRRKLSLVLFG